MICGGGGWACRTAVIEFAMALVCAAMSDRIAWIRLKDALESQQLPSQCDLHDLPSD